MPQQEPVSKRSLAKQMSKAKREPRPSSLEIRLLGPFHVEVDGQPADPAQFNRRKPKLLLKLLALQPHHQLHREQAMEVLWPGADPESAANNLHKTIHMARHALEPQLQSAADSHFILTEGQQMRLSAPVKLWIDVDEFERLAAEAFKGGDVSAHEQALAIYRGDLLIEDLYEDWTATRREQSRGTYQELLIKLARLHETRGQYHDGIRSSSQLVAIDSGNEEAHRLLMRLYALTGQRQQALRQYRECCEALRRELDAAPEQATVELYEQLVDGRVRPGGQRPTRGLSRRRRQFAGHLASG